MVVCHNKSQNSPSLGNASFPADGFIQISKQNGILEFWIWVAGEVVTAQQGMNAAFENAVAVRQLQDAVCRSFDINREIAENLAAEVEYDIASLSVGAWCQLKWHRQHIRWNLMRRRNWDWHVGVSGKQSRIVRIVRSSG